MDRCECIVISDATSVQLICRSRVDLSIIGLVAEAVEAEVAVGGVEGDLRRRKMVRSRDVWFGGCFYRWRSSGEVDNVTTGAGQTTQSSLRHVPVTEVIL